MSGEPEGAPAALPVALVSGAADGIGLATARAFAEAGYALGLLDVNAERLGATTERLRGGGTRVSSHVLDVTDAAAVERAVDSVASDLGQPTAVVSNVGIGPYGELLDLSVEQFRRTVDVNLTGTFTVTTATARQMVRAGVRGAICCVASGAAFLARVGAGPYCASKAGVEMYAKSMALELGRHGIRVNAVSPGFIDHGYRPGLGEFASSAYVAANRATVPLDHVGRASDVADAIVYLSSPRAAFITGAVMRVDGGSSAGKYGLTWDPTAGAAEDPVGAAGP